MSAVNCAMRWVVNIRRNITQDVEQSAPTGERRYGLSRSLLGAAVESLCAMGGGRGWSSHDIIHHHRGIDLVSLSLALESSPLPTIRALMCSRLVICCCNVICFDTHFIFKCCINTSMALVPKQSIIIDDNGERIGC